jgi:hypothetical protein
MDVITIASLFPNSEQPRHGIFVEERLWHLRQICDARFHVIAPVPWFPSGNPRFGEYGTFGRVPRQEERRGLLIRHPRFATIPKVGMSMQPFLYAAAIAPLVRRLVREVQGPVLLDGQFLYPDGVATAMLARWLKVPFILTARGAWCSGRARQPHGSSRCRNRSATSCWRWASTPTAWSPCATVSTSTGSTRSTGPRRADAPASAGRPSWRWVT